MTWRKEGARLALYAVNGQGAGNARPLTTDVWYCGTLWSVSRGLMFRKRLREGEGVLLDFQAVGIHEPSIHMRFVFTPLAVVWLADEGPERLRVVDVMLAKPWGRGYVPEVPARYGLELMPEVLKRVKVENRLKIEK